jgi:hypothetical protein
LTKENLLISHTECSEVPPLSLDAYTIIKPEPVAFISYPYEWCFSQLKDAALATLRIQVLALEHGMTLKDASAYNIQFVHGKPVLIDTLSFESLAPGRPWIAYRQFCQHFLAPLALAQYCDIRLLQLLRNNLDGIPLDLVSRLLPRKTWFSFGLLSHIHLHSRAQARYSAKSVGPTSMKMSRNALMGLIDNCAGTIKKRVWSEKSSTWGAYYSQTNYSAAAQEHKTETVKGLLNHFSPKVVWDLGANNGLYSRLALQQGCQTIAFDSDYLAVEKNYQEAGKNGAPAMLPLVMDLANPSHGSGWHNRERMALLERGPADTVMALALVHHLAIGNNVPLSMIADFLNHACSSLIIEFIPKSDSQVQRMLATREDIFDGYDKAGFEKAFSHCFTIEKEIAIKDSARIMYGMRVKSN